MYPDPVLHALTRARFDDLLGDATHARAVRAARGRRPAHRAPGLLRRLAARGEAAAEARRRGLSPA